MKASSDQKYNIKTKFKISPAILNKIVKLYCDRERTEDIEFLQGLGSENLICDALNTSLSNGISTDAEELKMRSLVYGSNANEPKQLDSYLDLIQNILEDLTIRILIVCAILSIILEIKLNETVKKSWMEGTGILIVLFVSVNIQCFVEFQKQLKFSKLNQIIEQKKIYFAIRDGKTTQIQKDQIQVGDILKIHSGIILPCDGVLLRAQEIIVDESVVTGQAIQTPKQSLQNSTYMLERNGQIESPVMISGSKVLNGIGTLLVITVGENSLVNEIDNLVRQVHYESTPLQKKLESLARDVSYRGSVTAILIFVSFCIRFIIDKIQLGHWQNEYITEILDYFIIAITIIVITMPAGLPLTITLALAYSCESLLMDNNIIRKVEACETLAQIDTICLDKSGIITSHFLTVKLLWNKDNIFIDNKYQSKCQLFNELILQSCFFNSEIEVCFNQPHGTPLEISIYEFIEKIFTQQEIKQIEKDSQIILCFPFSEKRKRMTTFYQSSRNTIRMVMKGAPEILINACNSYFDFETNSVKSFQETDIQFFKDKIEQVSSEGYKTLLLCFKSILNLGDQEFIIKDENQIYQAESQGFTFIGLMSFEEQIKSEVIQAIQTCKKAGIDLILVTSDHLQTAKTVAINSTLIGKDEKIMNCTQFLESIKGLQCSECGLEFCDCPIDFLAAINEDKPMRKDKIQNMIGFAEILMGTRVFARALPIHKYAMMIGLQQQGHMVAMVGDNAYDSSTLEKANLSFAKGLSGTEMSRESASIILTDDNFSSVLKGLLWGRSIYENIQTLIEFQLQVIIVVGVVALVGAIFIRQSILSGFQILWISVICDSLAAIAITSCKKQGQLSNPLKITNTIITQSMFKRIYICVVYQIIVLLIMTFVGDKFLPEFSDNADIDYFNNMLQFKYGNPNCLSTGCQCMEKYCSVVASGRLFNFMNKPDYLLFYQIQDQYVPSRHFTYIFNSAVLMFVFSLIQKNSNKMSSTFTLVISFILILQIIIVTFGSQVFDCYPNYGLHIFQWLLTIGIAIVGNIWNSFLSRVILEKNCLQVKAQNANPYDQNYRILNIKRGSIANTKKKFDASESVAVGIQSKKIKLDLRRSNYI